VTQGPKVVLKPRGMALACCSFVRNKSSHCGKGRALVVGRDGRYSCGEVEIVRRLFDAEGWTAGWTQPYICGGLSWGDWIMPVARENERLRQHHRLNAAQVARFRGTSEAAVRGHPDVIAWRDDETIFVESKSIFDGGLSQNQVDWFKAAKRLHLATAANYVIANQWVSSGDLACRSTFIARGRLGPDPGRLSRRRATLPSGRWPSSLRM
jgi:hypothetical protein